MPDFGLAIEVVALLALVAFAAGFVDAIAGGGGLITVPALLLAGVPPVQAIATNKLQGTFGVLSSTLAFLRAGAIDKRLVLPLGLAALAGGIGGAMLATILPVALLRLVIPFVLIAIALYMWLTPKFGDGDAHARMTPTLFACSVGLAIGAYDGLFGPGAGTFYLIGLILLCGFPLLRATAHTKLMNAASNLGALGLFLIAGHVLILPGLAMGFAAAGGAWLGARTSLKHGARIIRPLVITISILMALRLLFDPAHPFGQAIIGFFLR
ncbi:MAG: TSUP family transporter [Rhizobiales bacterium]|nr:TSUP family transporter [Hyphomicrobiales bacterium]